LLNSLFNSIDEINDKLVLEYINEAIKNQKEGKEIRPTKKGEIEISSELKKEFNKNKKLKISFDQLTPFKQREYCEYIEGAKREATKNSRLEKILPMILIGIGLHDKYR